MNKNNTHYITHAFSQLGLVTWKFMYTENDSWLQADDDRSPPDHLRVNRSQYYDRECLKSVSQSIRAFLAVCVRSARGRFRWFNFLPAQER